MDQYKFECKLKNKQKEEIAEVRGVVLASRGFADTENRIRAAYLGRKQWPANEEGKPGTKDYFDSTVAFIEIVEMAITDIGVVIDKVKR